MAIHPASKVGKEERPPARLSVPVARRYDQRIRDAKPRLIVREKLRKDLSDG
jgi:hypothetical protein